ncbi:MAG: hypothetical protein CMH61_01145 [Nanoarchaeota archaeon]|nr:hypothetical protein [Nanoarchaeota archaeon]|tara:strand:+ start:72 stop:1118 length:1047 start_codon:yes stop_codon:yes gene_type:complete
MRLLIDILHPAQANIWRNFILEMEKRGHEIIVIGRDKDCTLDLLDHYGIRYKKISSLGKGFAGLGKELISRTYKLTKLCKKYQPDLLLGCMGPSISITGKLLGIPSLVFYDNESAKLTNFYVYKLATKYITSSSYEENPPNHVTYNGYQNLAYCHPNWFTPSKEKVLALGINPDKKFFLMRFVSWGSSHDLGAAGFSDKVSFVKELAKHGQVVISAEKNLKLPKELWPYAIIIPPHLLDDIIAFAHLTVGESASVAADGACFGVPSIYLANTKRGYTNEMDTKFGLVFNYTNQEKAMQKVIELAERSKESISSEFQEKRKELLNHSVDMVTWMVEYVEDYVQASPIPS